jgi:DNA-binding transcriptional LysR family regulator
VIADQPHAQDSFERYFSEEGLPAPRDIFRTNSLNLMMSLVRSGKFLSPLPQHLIDGRSAETDLVALSLEAAIERQAGLIYRAGVGSRPAVEHVLAEFRKVARPSP